ncbi:hypothetical protein Q428_13280 [Fervidicella metallireducens AeB]|uniref:Glycosyltransferase 2-like domain-containing protein n=1 Tax=Fervidicella metallireducens AeB TaxID=1403537 RepID=A0A017RU71_9CLOT|nr:glycosyltransferase family 2 protein [Fervidicella metallireducens]EYE87440.1 hypothetical protein Q428_13280 [Fervidicella metallireducens AeB]
MKIDIIIPAYNEEKNIDALINEIKMFGNYRIIVVDDGSKDKTFEMIKKYMDVICLKNNKNMGKGYSIKRALDYAKGDFVFLVDGDVYGISEELNEINNYLDKYDCVIFYPVIKGGGFGFLRNFAKYIVKKRTGFEIDWTLSGIRLIKRELLQNIKEDLDDRFAFEISLTLNLLYQRRKILVVNSKFSHRITGKTLFGFIHRGIQFMDVLRFTLK